MLTRFCQASFRILARNWLADLGNFGEVAECGSDLGKAIGGRSGEGELFGVSDAEEATRFGYQLTAMAAALGEGVGAEWKGIDEFTGYPLLKLTQELTKVRQNVSVGLLRFERAVEKGEKITLRRSER